MVNIWLIRPGEKARLWENCRDKKCIAIGWDNENGYSKYKSLNDVKKDHSSDYDANAIWSFYKEIKIGDVIVAPGGINSVLGIGKVTSDYIDPTNPENPGIEYKNVRMVNWLITDKLENIPLSINLPQKTLTKENKNQRWEEIKAKYMKMNPENEKIFNDLIRSDSSDLSDLINQFLKEIDGKELQDHITQHDSRRKSVQDKLRKENVGLLTENEMETILKDTDAVNGIKYGIKDIFIKNDGFYNFKEKLISFLETTNLDESDINKFVDAINLMGPGFISELLCLKYPNKFWIWNSVTDDFLSKINIDIKATLPRGKKGDIGAQYNAMQTHMQNILDLLQKHGLKDSTFLDLDVFVYWMKDRTIPSKKIISDADNIKFPILDQTFSQTKNVILYGPPGTGKTYIAQQFIEYYLKDQISTPKTIEEINLDIIRDLNWYQVIALTIYLKGKDQKITVPKLKNEKLIKDYFEIVKGRKKHLGQTLWSQLGSHSTPDSKVVKYENRAQLALFDKTSESEWYLIPEGIEYIENSFEDILSILSGDKKPEDETTIKQYYKFVTFHQSYGYEDFIEGLKPKNDNDTKEILYEIEPGVFKSICSEAKNYPNNKYIMVIDEINRGNIAKIFGELITLIEDDKRNQLTVTLPYSKEDFTVPSNLYIIGTMNTADRSIALLDLALRRRFTFLEMMPDYSIINYEIEELNIGDLLKELNYMVAALIDRDHQIGHSYFCGIVKKIKNEELESAKTELQFVWYRKIIPLLQEYFYNDWEQLKLILGDFVSENNNSNSNAKLKDRMVNKNYSIVEFEDWDRFSNALRYIVSSGTKTEIQVDATESENVEGENES